MCLRLRSAAWLALVLSPVLPGRGAALQLTKEVWDEKSSGKSVLVVFVSDWESNQDLQANWQKLSADFATDRGILVGEVHCGGAGEGLCNDAGIDEYPTVLYGDASSLHDYRGELSHLELAKFAREHLGPRCAPSNLDACDASQRGLVESFMAQPLPQLREVVEKNDKLIDKADAELDSLVEALTKDYELFKKMEQDLEHGKAEGKALTVPAVKALEDQHNIYKATQAEYEAKALKRNQDKKDLETAGHGLMKAVLWYRLHTSKTEL